jgi:tetratricopeptide (TPR) repeat protein
MNSVMVNHEEQLRTVRRLCEAGEWSQVLDFAREWQTDSPDDHRPFYYMALGHSGLGQFIQADTAYRRALALNNSDPIIWRNLATLLFKHLKRPRDGIACMARALELDPDHKVGWYSLAGMVGRLGNHQQAIAFADRALALDPLFVEAHLQKGVAAQALGKKDVLRDVCNALSAIPPEKFRRAR